MSKNMLLDSIILKRNNFELLPDEDWSYLKIAPFVKDQEYFISNQGRVARNQYFSQALKVSLPWECELVYTNINPAGDPIINAYRPNFGSTTITLKKAVFKTFCDESQGIGPRIENVSGDKADCRYGNLYAYCPAKAAMKRKVIAQHFKTSSQIELDAVYNSIK